MASTDAGLIRPEPRPQAPLRLFCFHHAGVGASAFRGWAQHLTAETNVEVCLVQLPGREGSFQQPVVSSMAQAVATVIEKMHPLLDRPFAFYGHSLGARIAFESTLNLRRRFKLQPIHLFVGASPAPQLPWRHAAVRDLQENDLIDEIQRRYGPLPREVLADAEMRALVLPILRADFGIIETYIYSPDTPLDCGITAFGGIHDPMVPLSSLEAWRQQTSGRFRIQMMDGNHLFLRSCRVQLLAAIASELKLCSENQEAFQQFH